MRLSESVSLTKEANETSDRYGVEKYGGRSIEVVGESGKLSNQWMELIHTQTYEWPIL